MIEWRKYCLGAYYIMVYENEPHEIAFQIIAIWMGLA